MSPDSGVPCGAASISQFRLYSTSSPVPDGPLAVVHVGAREEEAARADAEGAPVVDHLALAPGDEVELVRRVGVPFDEPVAFLEHDAEPAHPDEVPEHGTLMSSSERWCEALMRPWSMRLPGPEYFPELAARGKGTP